MQRLATRYHANGKELETLVCPFGSKQLERWVVVPPVPMRDRIVDETHEAMGHVGRDKLVEALLTSWWWERIREDVAAALRRCPACVRDAVSANPHTTPP